MATIGNAPVFPTESVLPGNLQVTGNATINGTTNSVGALTENSNNVVNVADTGVVTEGMLSSTYYEEGTWSATFFTGLFGGGTNLGTTTGTYTRIGNVVTIVWERGSVGAPTSTRSFTGVPFNFVDGRASGPTSDGVFMFSDGANLNSVSFRVNESQYARGTLTYRIT
jgi:hypothetical protein